MHTCPRYLWITWLSISLALVLSSCGAHEGQTTTFYTCTANTGATKDVPVGITCGDRPNYPPLAFKQQGHFAGLGRFCTDVEVELGRFAGVV